MWKTISKRLVRLSRKTGERLRNRTYQNGSAKVQEDLMALVYDPEKGGFIRPSSNENLYDYFQKKGFFFSKEILTRYFLSLKTKPFVILTGISGTGKTKIAQIFADYIC
jgi:hypothetical protein